jgi:hypothetical protein
VALSRLTKGGLGGSFTLEARIAFGNGCDWPSYVATDSPPQGKLARLLPAKIAVALGAQDARLVSY